MTNATSARTVLALPTPNLPIKGRGRQPTVALAEIAVLQPPVVAHFLFDRLALGGVGAGEPDLPPSAMLERHPRRCQTRQAPDRGRQKCGSHSASELSGPSICR